VRESQYMDLMHFNGYWVTFNQQMVEQEFETGRVRRLLIRSSRF